MRLKRRQVNMEKAATLSIILNTAEIVLLVALLLSNLIDPDSTLAAVIRPLSMLTILMLIFEGFISVRDGFLWKKSNRQTEMVKDAFSELDDLNLQLRKQRHDFLNHLQVVYSLVDMGENDEATRYIETVYGEMRRLSTGMKTAKPAINALLQAKLSQAEQRGITLNLNITSTLEHLPLNDWEMCRILANLIDNAMDALEGKENGQITVELSENLKNYSFAVRNNGAKIEDRHIDRLFQNGFTTKASGHGLGLPIVKELIEGCGGEIKVSSNEKETVFSGFLPKDAENK